MNEQKVKNLIFKISEIGRNNPNPPMISDIFPFRHYFENGELNHEKLSENDGLWTRREILTRYLLLRAVLEQGFVKIGKLQLLHNVINNLYEKEVRILHKPLDFFKEIGISVDVILENHALINFKRILNWTIENHSIPINYSPIMDNSKQVLNYAIYRWGIPLTLPYLLEKDLHKENKQSSEPLVDFLESFGSAEKMSQAIRYNERYGLGKAISDNTAHRFAKWYVQTFALSRRIDKTWSKLSYELPFNRNVGRVLFRTGFFSEIPHLSDLKNWRFIGEYGGIRGRMRHMVPNLQEQQVQTFNTFDNNEQQYWDNEGQRYWDNGIQQYWNNEGQQYLNNDVQQYWDNGVQRYFNNKGQQHWDNDREQYYLNIIRQYFGSRKRSIQIQQIPNAFLDNSDYGIGDLDDGITYIATKFCRGEVPLCEQCPIKDFCDEFLNNKNI